MLQKTSLPSTQPAVEADASCLLTVVQAAKLLAVAPSTLLRWAIEGAGPVQLRRGRRFIRYHRADVVRYIEGLRDASLAERRDGAKPAVADAADAEAATVATPGQRLRARLQPAA